MPQINLYYVSNRDSVAKQASGLSATTMTWIALHKINIVTSINAFISGEVGSLATRLFVIGWFVFP